ncbi:hypothetical protein B0H15DRAFT_788970 [Mycena belliarum]|uniref:Uncharacterized protein n=1 Tax=Mycena belliarum TaxID=1033014 RepID=A0AAD6TSZ5_9AGAR|nr:hypothetical protein B0H15DRAFT_788970 [Mycena belliae]
MSTPDELLELVAGYTNLEDITTAALVLAYIVSTYCQQPGPSLDRRFTKYAPCLELLERESGLHELLKRAHTGRNYEDVLTSPRAALIRKDPLPRATQEFLDELRPLVESFVTSDTPFKTWLPKYEGRVPLDHMKSLELFTLSSDGLPLVILKDLGSFADDASLLIRLKNIFARGKKTVLVNTSGSGKTRLLFEGLCREWGFYFTAIRDSSYLGSQDISGIVVGLADDFDFEDSRRPGSRDPVLELQSHHLLAHRRLSEVLLARILIFRLFLDVAKKSKLNGEHKKRWLLLQLISSLGPYVDIFRTMTNTLRYSEEHDTQAAISDAIAGVRHVLGPDSHLFLVLDEAQKSAVDLAEVFDAEDGKYPVLIKMLETWESVFPRESVSFVVAGTEIPSRIFEGTEAVCWTSDTGAFDDPALHEQYLRRFLPPTFLSTKLGEAFLDRAWRWTRGRYRYTATLVTELLLRNFQRPHSQLDDYIATLSQYKPTDAQRLVHAERSSFVILPSDGYARGINGNDFSTLRSSSASDTRFLLQEVLFHYLVTGRHPPMFGRENIQAVSLGLGRFSDSEMSRIVADEPIVLAGAALWMQQNRPRLSDFGHLKSARSYLIDLKCDPPPTGKTFAKFLAYYFSQVFDSRPALSDIFTFPKPVLAWANQPAELVGLHATEVGHMDHSTISGSDIVRPFATIVQGVVEIVSWMEHTDRSLFCIPTSGNPDLLFMLRLGDGSFVWVILQATPAVSDGSELIASLEEERLFCDTVTPFLAFKLALMMIELPINRSTILSL